MPGSAEEAMRQAAAAALPDTIATLAMAVVLLVWVVFCAVMFVRAARRQLAESGLVGHAVCEKCGARFDMAGPDLARGFLTKSRSVTRTRVRGGALVNEPEYGKFAKRARCPACGESAWVDIENVNELNAQLRSARLRCGVKWLAVMAAGGLVVMAARGIAGMFL